MKKWYNWLILAGIWLVGSVINYLCSQSIVSTVVPAVIFLLLSIGQLIFEKQYKKN